MMGGAEAPGDRVRVAPADGDPDGRPAGLGQDDRGREARAAAAHRAPQLGRARGVRHPAPGGGRAARRSLGEQAGATVYEQGTGGSRRVEIARWGARARAHRRQGRADRRHRRAPARRRRADGRAASRSATRPSPTRSLLVVDAMTGQDAVNVAEQFARGGRLRRRRADQARRRRARRRGAVGARGHRARRSCSPRPGEKLDAFERFHPDRMAQRILGMGDVLTLIEKAGREVRRARRQAARAAARARATSTSRTSSASSARCAGWARSRACSGCCPGVGAQLRGIKVDEREIDRIEAIILSMTPERAPAAGADQGLAAAAHRARLGHQRAGGQPARQAVRAGAQGDAPGRPGGRMPDLGALMRQQR